MDMQVQSQGVDSLGSGFGNPISVVRELARKEREYTNNGGLMVNRVTMIQVVS